MEAPTTSSLVDRRKQRLAARHVEEPSVQYIGPRAVWFIPRPKSPRITLRTCIIAWLLLAPPVIANLLWVQAESSTWWPFGRPVAHNSELLLRYGLVAVVCMAYVTAVSVPVWWRHASLARRDLRELDRAIQAESWEQAGLLLHRYCLSVSAVWRKLPGFVSTWDAVVKGHLPRHRRLYVYHRKRRPALPEDPTVGFAISVVRPPRPSPWSAAALLPLALMLYLLIVEIVRAGQFHQAFVFNTVMLSILLVSYTAYYFMALLGRASYLRFAPGVMQFVRYQPLRPRPLIESFELRKLDVVLDLASAWPGLTLLNTPGWRREVFRLPRDGTALDAVFRAVMSTASSPPLPEDLLVD